MRLLRTIAAVGFGLLAVVGLVASTLGVWTNRTVYDSDHFAATVEDALAEPEVTDAIAGYLTDELFAVVPVTDGLVWALPGRTDALAPTLTDELRRRATARLARHLAEPATRARIGAAVRTTHATLLQAVETGSVANAQIVDGAVVVNLLPLLVDGLGVLPDNVLTRRVTLPDLAYDGDHTEQLATLSTALGVALPAHLGLVEVYRGDTVDRADTLLANVRDALALFHRALAALVVTTVVGFVGAFGCAVNRRRAVAALSVGAFVLFGITALIVRTAVDRAPNFAVDPANEVVARAVLGAFSDSLIRLLDIALVAGAVVAVVTVVLGALPRLRGTS